MARGKTEKLGDILKNVLSRRALSGNYQVRQIQNLLSSILGKEKSKHIRVSRIRNKCLVIFVDSSSLSYELEAFWSEEIKNKIKGSGVFSINKIKFEIYENKL